jgi:tetratricopeptide (TPR) repeat protein
MTCGQIHLYAQAERAFGEIVKHYPDDLDVLHDLGLAAARASDYGRARRAFETVLKARPQDVDTLYDLGRVEEAQHDYTRAMYLLAQARQLAPQRPDVILALARAAQFGGYYGGSILAYDEYLKLRPDDDLVRCDRALVFGFTRGGLEGGLRDLRLYLEKHPTDGVGYYDLAQLSDRVDRDEALRCVSKAIQASPELEKAHYYRAWLLEKLGRLEESAAELQRVILLDAHDVRAWDLLGLDYLNLRQPAQAEKPLRKALALEPNDPDVLFHLSRALIETGRESEAQPLVKGFKEAQNRSPPVSREEAGMIEAASLSSAERSKQVVEQLTQHARTHPIDAEIRLSLASALLSTGRLGEALSVFRELLTANPQADLLEKAGVTFLRFDQFVLARQFVERAASAQGSMSLDLAIAVLFTDGPSQAMKILNEVPEGQDTGDRLLLRAKILDAAGQSAEADRVLTGPNSIRSRGPRLP